MKLRVPDALSGCAATAALLVMTGAMLAQGQTPSAPAGAPKVPLTLESATPVKLRLVKTLYSATAHASDTVDFEVLEDVKVNGVVAILKGAPAWGTVVRAKKGRFGKAGKLTVDIDYVQLADGQKCALRAGRAGASLLAWRQPRHFLFWRAKETAIPEGTEVTAFTMASIGLDAAKFGVRQTPRQPAAPNSTLQAPAPATPAPISSSTSSAAATAKVTVMSTPNACDIMVDGKYMGDTPSTLKLPAGNHTITIQKLGYQTWLRTIKITAGSEITVNATLPTGP